MARSFLTAINLNKNELQNAAVQNLATAPSSPVKGQLYYDSVGNVLYWWNGTAWVAAQGGAGVGYGASTATTTFGLAKTDGVATTVARSDHTHGTPTHVAADHSTIPISALAAATATVSMGGFVLSNVATPVSGTDATNKNYVDNLVTGLSWKDSVRVASTTNVTTSGTPTVDGVTTVAGNRVLLMGQTLPELCGIYVVAAGAWARAVDADTGPELASAAVFVEEGTLNADTAWVCTNNQNMTLGSDAVTFVKFVGGGTVTAGAGMTQSGNTLNVIGDSTMTVAADVLGVADAGVTNAKLANMAALTVKGNSTGSAAVPADVTMAQLAAILGPAGVVRKQAFTCAAATSTVVTHSFSSRDVGVTVYNATTPWDEVDCDVEHTSTTTVTVRFAVAPTAGQYNIVVFG